MSNSNEEIEFGFYSHSFEGDINNYLVKTPITAGVVTTVKLRLDYLLVDGRLPGFGFAVFGGPAWDAKLEDGYTPDRTTITISNVRMEGGVNKDIDLSSATWAKGNDGTGYTNANGSGTASYNEGVTTISGGYRYDGHKVTFDEMDN